MPSRRSSTAQRPGVSGADRRLPPPREPANTSKARTVWSGPSACVAGAVCGFTTSRTDVSRDPGQRCSSVRACPRRVWSSPRSSSKAVPLLRSPPPTGSRGPGSTSCSPATGPRATRRWSRGHDDPGRTHGPPRSPWSTSSSRCATSSTTTAWTPERTPWPGTCVSTTRPPCRCPRSGGSCTERDASTRNRTSAPLLLPALRGRPAQRDLADRLHPRPPRRRHGHGGPDLHRRPLPLRPDLHRPARRHHTPGHRRVPASRCRPRHPRQRPVRQRPGLHRPPPRRPQQVPERAGTTPHRAEELPTQPPPDLRQGRTRPADPQEVARRPTTRSHPRRPAEAPRVLCRSYAGCGSRVRAA